MRKTTSKNPETTIPANTVQANTVPTNTVQANTVPADNDCLDWDAEISNDGAEFLILPEGDYLFQVVDFERGRHEPSAKLPACNKATLTLEVRTGDGIARARTDLFLHRFCEWKISSFFRCIGLKQKGEQLKMNWNQVPGAWGRAHLRPSSFVGNDGQTHQRNEVIRFLDYDPTLVMPGFTDVTDTTDIPY